MTTPNSRGGELVQQFLGWLAEPDLEALTDTVVHWLMVLVLVAVTVLVVYFVAREIVLRWYFKGNGAARLMYANRKKIGERFELTIRWVSRDGSIRIEPRETKRWAKEGLEAELTNMLRHRIRVRLTPGLAWVSDRVEIPETVTGVATYDPVTGQVHVGVDAETGKTSGFSIRECSAMVVGALPGGGKSVLLDHLVQAVGDQAEITTFDGKLDSPEEITDVLVQVKEEMQERLANRIDFWNDRQGKCLLMVVIDEAQTLFQPVSKQKGDKDAAFEREALVRDLIQRGRSAGVLVVLASQRITVDAIPSAIRDLAGVKVAGPMTRPEDAELVLGVRPGPGEPSPVGAQRGQFVVSDGRGLLRAIQVYAPET